MRYLNELPRDYKEEARKDIMSRVHRLIVDSRSELPQGADDSEIVAVETVAAKLSITKDLDEQVTTITGQNGHVAADTILMISAHRSGFPTM